MNEKIDFVIMWVDGSDPKWLQEKNKYSTNKIDVDDAINRYRDMGTLKYWFRSVEKYTPWVNKIHFITCGHLPDWLNTNNPKLNIVKHEDYIPKEYLPTFSANPIELNLHRINELEEKFVLFNDDIFIINPLNPTFFFKNGLPCDFWKENTFRTEDANDNFFDHIILNDLFLINKNFNKREFIKNNFFKVFNLKYGRRNIRYFMLCRWQYFCGFDIPHTANSFLKSSFKDIWEHEFDILDRTSSNKFRNVFDVNQWVVHWWQMLNGQFSVKSYHDVGKYFCLKENNTELFDYIKSKKSTVVCINDTNLNLNFDKVTKELIEVFEEKFPEKSSFEK